MEIAFLGDFKNPQTGKTYLQENLEKPHNIPIGSLVELENGVRMFVVEHQRDFDNSPLYGLSPEIRWATDKQFAIQFQKYSKFAIEGGYPAACLKIVNKSEE